MSARRGRARTHPRLASDVARSFLALGIGVPLAFVISQGLALLAIREGRADLLAVQVATYLTYWSVLAIVLIVITLAVFSPLDGDTLRRWLSETTPSPRRARRLWWAIMGGGAVSWAVSVSAATVIALLLIAATPAFRTDPIVFGCGIAVLVSSFAAIIVAYAVRYAREYATAGGIRFSGDADPRFADFVYLAVQVSTTFSGSDVELTETGARKLVAAHSIVAFAFNSVIIALLVSVLLSSLT